MKDKFKVDHLFIHSKCCGGHWELSFDKKTKEYDLSCEHCGLRASSRIKVVGPDLSKRGCDDCNNKGE